MSKLTGSMVLMETAAPSNVQIGSMIGMGHSGVSRIRSGHRRVSLDTMRRIARAIGWSIQEQSETLAEPDLMAYAEEFNRRFAEFFSALEPAPVPEVES